MPPGYKKIKKKARPVPNYPQAKQVTAAGGETIKGAGGQDILVPKDDYIVEYADNLFYPLTKAKFEETFEFKTP